MSPQTLISLLTIIACFALAGPRPALHGQSESTVIYTSAEGLPVTDCNAICEGPEGFIWIGTNGGGLISFDGKEFSSHTLGAGRQYAVITTIKRDGRGGLILHTPDTSWRYADGAFRPHGLPGSEPTHIRGISPCDLPWRDSITDRNGESWYAGPRGICRLRKQPFARIGRAEGLRNPEVRAIAEGLDSILWIATQGDRLYGYTGNRMESHTLPFTATDLHMDKRNRLWISSNEGILLWESPERRYAIPGALFPDPRITRITRDSSGNMWCGTMGGGLIRFSVKEHSLLPEARVYDAEDGCTNAPISDICTIGDVVWAGTKGDGVYRIAPDGGITHFGTGSGIPSTHISDLHIDRRASVWGTAPGRGIFRIHPGGGIDIFTVDDGLSSPLVHLIGTDAEDRLWIGTEKGVDLFSVRKNGLRKIGFFGEAEGLTGRETVPRGFFLDSGGTVWISTHKGLAALPGDAELPQTNRPLIHFRSIRQDTNRMSPDSQGVVFSHDQNRLTFGFRAVDLQYPSEIRYRWRMIGLERKWVGPSPATGVQYTGLEPGEYTFTVESISSNGVTGGPIRWAFRITPPFTSTSTFYFLAASGGFILLAILVWLVQHFSRRRERHIRQKLELDLRLIQWQQQAMQMQMNPHFIANTLAGIKGMIAREEGKKARYFLSKFSGLIRRMLEQSREEWIPLTQEVELLEEYVALQSVASGKKVKLEIDDGPIDEPVLIPPMMIQPLVENCFRHAFAGRREGHIFVAFRFRGRSIECRVEDDGAGYLPADRKKDSGSISLEVIRRRLSLQTGLKENEVFGIDARPGGGTIARLRLPYKPDK